MQLAVCKAHNPALLSERGRAKRTRYGHCRSAGAEALTEETYRCQCAGHSDSTDLSTPDLSAMRAGYCVAATVPGTEMAPRPVDTPGGRNITPGKSQLSSEANIGSTAVRSLSGRLAKCLLE